MEASAVPLGHTRTRPMSATGVLLRLRSDEQLLALFRAGNEDAFQLLHDRYRPRLLAYVRQMLPAGARGDAEDALQDVFIRAYRALRADERPVAVRAWLYRVAHNRCIDAVRRPAPMPVERSERQCDDRHDPCDEAERRETLEQLVSDLQRLPEAQRSCLLLRELEGLSYAELGVVLQTSQPAVKSLLVRARMGLADAAEARGADCEQIRADLAASCDRGVRMSSRARLHLRDCEPCSAYHGILRTTQKQVAGLAPNAGPLATLLKLIGIGSGGAAAGGGAIGGGAASGTTIAGLAGTSSLAAKVAVVVVVGFAATGEAVHVVGPAAQRHQATAVAGVAPAARSASAFAASPATHGAVRPGDLAAPQPARTDTPAADPVVAPPFTTTATEPVVAPDAAEPTGGIGAPAEPGDPATTTTSSSSVPKESAPVVVLDPPKRTTGDLTTGNAPAPAPTAGLGTTSPATASTPASTGAAEAPR